MCCEHHHWFVWVYYSTTELHDPGESSDMDAELIADHHDIAMDDLNGQPLNDARKTPLHPDLYLEDGVSSIDYVLVSKEIETEDQAEHEERRETFENNLRKEGLTLEVDCVEDVPLRFVKIHAPFEVCTRYAEILKLRMPMREKLDAEFHDHRVVLHFPGLPALEFTPPAVFQDMTDCVSKIFNFVRLDRNVFPPKNRHFTAVYSRDKEYLFDVTEEFFTAAVRARIIDFILRRKKFNDSENDDFAFGIEKMLSESTYEAAYPIHEGDLHVEGNDRSLLFKNWAALRNFYKYQPLDYVKDYFGVKIGLYFAWLGFYTYMLIPASIVGLLCFIYAVSTINDHMPSNDICNKNLNIFMCPLCDKFCDFWKLDGFCFHAKFTYLVDNPSTIFFTAFMSLWAALFLEMWKRYSAEITHRWDLTGFDIQEEHPRPQYLARLAHIKKKTVNIVTKTVEPKPPFWKMRFPGIMISLSSVVLLVLMALVAVIAVILYRMAVLAALAIHGESVITSYAIIFTSTTAAFINLICIMIFNQIYARVAERLTELTQTEFDDSKLSTCSFYSSIFYIAFFKGKMVGYPGKYNRVFGSRQEECSPGGCLLELSVQLAIIMVGKQAMNTCMEMVIPMLWKWYNMLTVPESQREAHNRWPRWAKDFRLVNFDPRGLFPEYLEMATTPSSFCFQAFIIAFTSNFIPELVYRHVVSDNGTLEGFLDHSLATFDVNHYPPLYKVNETDGITECRYPDYRNPPGAKDQYDYAPIFWHILAARLAFVVVFENVVCVIILFIKWIIPDMPYRLQEQIRREAYVTNELIVEQELRRAREANTTASSSPRSPLRRQYSEPARNRNVQDVRFRIDRGFVIEVSRR
ncbi:putative anoctamin-4 isoform X1 [Penaeus vannamei]|uniref:Anoctamin n=1 Tax=Penaeus vannamei TaxID=6689 RepID=A0A3R7Q385_PENVA|nr:putative anoctamin-4 isoform X1 [Penaeus vannamei]